MNSKEILLGALQYYGIEILKEDGNHIIIARNYDIEVESNGLYKLRSEGQVIAPFDDVDELCRFVLI